MEKDYNVENVEINITEHCYNRYKERVRNVGNEQDIKIEIKKLFISSNCYYEGQIGKSTNNVKVFINRNGWVFIVDKDGKTLITLYKVDLNVDSDEVNQMYVDKALEKITLYNTMYNEAFEDAKKEQSNYSNEIKGIDTQIEEYENVIRQLKKRKDALFQVSNTSTAKSNALKVELRNILEDFIVKDKLKIVDKDVK